MHFVLKTVAVSLWQIKDSKIQRFFVFPQSGWTIFFVHAYVNIESNSKHF
jgi:hypothetical protein